MAMGEKKQELKRKVELRQEEVPFFCEEPAKLKRNNEEMKKHCCE